MESEIECRSVSIQTIITYRNGDKKTIREKKLYKCDSNEPYRIITNVVIESNKDEIIENGKIYSLSKNMSI